MTRPTPTPMKKPQTPEQKKAAVERTRQWRIKNPDRNRALCRDAMARRLARDPEKVRAYQRELRARDPDHYRKYKREHYATHRASEIKASVRKSRAANAATMASAKLHHARWDESDVAWLAARIDVPSKILAGKMGRTYHAINSAKSAIRRKGSDE